VGPDGVFQKASLLIVMLSEKSGNIAIIERSVPELIPEADKIST
jgi:hypothetical protein